MFVTNARSTIWLCMINQQVYRIMNKQFKFLLLFFSVKAIPDVSNYNVSGINAENLFIVFWMTELSMQKIIIKIAQKKKKAKTIAHTRLKMTLST